MAGTIFKIIGIIVVILVVLGIGIGVLGAKANSAEVNIQITSIHIGDVEMFVYIDDNLVIYDEESSAGQNVYNTNVYRFPIWESTKTITIKAVCQGGAIETTDTTTLVVKNGQSYTVNLIV